MTTKVYGEGEGSDDVLLEGDLDATTTIDDTESGGLLMFSDATLLKVSWGKDLDAQDGEMADIWEIEVLNVGFLFDRIVPCTDTDASPPSDTVYFKDGIRWCYSADA